MAKILVTAASKHGSTLDIIDSIARRLTAHGHDVVDRTVDEVGDVAGFDAAIIGSGIYVGRWMSEALTFVTQHAEELRRLPVWLFSSGPLGDPPLPAGDPTDVAGLVQMVGARGHRVFRGRLDGGQLGLGEKVIVAAVRAPKGDFRDFSVIEAWADEIADVLDHELPVAPPEVDHVRQALLEASRN
jgi:menaquinone-dependent protoporphyrinogen oxidase